MCLAFGRDRQYALDLAGMRGDLKSTKAKEGAECSQAKISAAWRAMSAFLYLIEKAIDEWCVEFRQQ